MQFLNLLGAALNLVLGFFSNPVTIIVLVLLGALAFLAYVVKVGWAITAWTEVLAILGNAWGDLKVDPLAFVLLGLIYVVDAKLFIYAAIACIVATKLGLHFHIPIPLTTQSPATAPVVQSKAPAPPSPSTSPSAAPTDATKS
jgi:hypothetical protein